MLENFFGFRKPISTEQTVQTGIKPQTPVYISGDYHSDNGVTAAEVPRFGWIVKEVHSNNTATIEYENKRLLMKVTLVLPCKYIKVER